MWDRRFISSLVVSMGSIGVLRISMISPSSMPADRYIAVTPVSLQWFRIDHCTGLHPKLRQNARVHVDAAELRNVQHPLGKDFSIGHNEDEVGRKRAQLLYHRIVPERFRL